MNIALRLIGRYSGQCLVSLSDVEVLTASDLTCGEILVGERPPIDFHYSPVLGGITFVSTLQCYLVDVRVGAYSNNEDLS